MISLACGSRVAVVVVGVVAVAASSPSLLQKKGGEACASDDDCRSEICQGGFCHGGSCPCEDDAAGFDCVEHQQDLILFTSSSHSCEKPCAGESDCPDPWFCRGGDGSDATDNHCAFPPPFDVVLSGPTTARSGDVVELTLAPTSAPGVALDIAQATWSLTLNGTPTDLAVLDDDGGAHATLTVNGGAGFFISVTATDTEGQPSGSTLVIDTCGNHGDTCDFNSGGTCCDSADLCEGAPVTACLTPLAASIVSPAEILVGADVTFSLAGVAGDDAGLIADWYLGDGFGSGDQIASGAATVTTTIEDTSEHTLQAFATNARGQTAFASTTFRAIE